MRTDPSGSQPINYTDLSEVVEQFALFQDRLNVNEDIQESISVQIKQLETEMKRNQAIYPSFESVEARMKQYQQDITCNMCVMKDTFEKHVEKMGESLRSLEASNREIRINRGKGNVYMPVAESEYREFKDQVWAKFQIWETALNKFQRETPTRTELDNLQATTESLK